MRYPGHRSPTSLPLRMLACALLLIALSTAAEDGADKNDAAEGEEESNLVILPIFVTEPAIGEGLGAGIVYFHDKDSPEQPKVTSGDALVRTARQPQPPPTATGLFAAYTNNESMAVGAGHVNSLRDDTYRIEGALASMRVNAAIFARDIPVDFELEGEFLYGGVKRRLGASNTFLGMALALLNADSRFSIPLEVPSTSGLTDFAFTNIGLALTATYDVRDDTMMPGQGQLLDLSLWRYDDALGSDFNYWSSTLKFNSFHPVGEHFVIGLRAEASTVSGRPPFFAVPYVSLRGIPALRFQGDTAGVFEAEARYNFSADWAGVAFAGTGFTAAGEEILETSESIRAAGIGIRYRVLQEQNVWIGFDVARGPEESAWYIQMGHPW